MKNKFIPSVLSLFIFLTACSHLPSRGETILSHAKETQEMGEQWTKGEKLIKDGNAMQKKGKKLVSDGKTKISKGEKQVDKGNDMISEGVEKVERGLELQRENEERFVLKENNNIYVQTVD